MPCMPLAMSAACHTAVLHTHRPACRPAYMGETRTSRRINARHLRVAAAELAGPAAPAEAAAAKVDEGPEDEDDDFLELPEPQHIRIQDGFTPLAQQLREHFVGRVGDPLRTRSDRFVWDYWYIPGQYCLLRTPAEHFFPPELYDQLEDALVEFGERQLGCRGISPLWVSYYVHGCRQELHADNPHGPWAFVLSLTDWEGRPFTGGETQILQPQVLDYWRGFDPALGTETPQLSVTLAVAAGLGVQLTKVEPQFNRLTLFDPRFPHGVRMVEGTQDPARSRVVLHGWFTSPTPFFNSGLSEEEATPTLNATLEQVYAALAEAPPVTGALVVRLEVSGATGRVGDLHWLTHTLVARPQGLEPGREPLDAVMEVVGCIAEGLLGAKFPPSKGGAATEITVPFVFE